MMADLDVQLALDTHTAQSCFWTSREGQEALAVAAQYGFTPSNTNRERWSIIYALRRRDSLSTNQKDISYES